MKTKTKLIAVSLSVLLFSSLLAVTLYSPLEINLPRVFAQEAPPSCTAKDWKDEDVSGTFLRSECAEVKLQEPQTFYRYYGGQAKKRGSYLTTDQYQTNVKAIQELALNQNWGNDANKMVSVKVPAGTTVYQGIAAPQTPSSCYPGGGQQTFIQDSRNPELVWTEEPDLTVQNFNCPQQEPSENPDTK